MAAISPGTRGSAISRLISTRWKRIASHRALPAVHRSSIWPRVSGFRSIACILARRGRRLRWWGCRRRRGRRSTARAAGGRPRPSGPWAGGRWGCRGGRGGGSIGVRIVAEQAGLARARRAGAGGGRTRDRRNVRLSVFTVPRDDLLVGLDQVPRLARRELGRLVGAVAAELARHGGQRVARLVGQLAELVHLLVGGAAGAVLELALPVAGAVALVLEAVLLAEGHAALERFVGEGRVARALDAGDVLEHGVVLLARELRAAGAGGDLEELDLGGGEGHGKSGFDGQAGGAGRVRVERGEVHRGR
jgi:hypothetical protein